MEEPTFPYGVDSRGWSAFSARTDSTSAFGEPERPTYALRVAKARVLVVDHENARLRHAQSIGRPFWLSESGSRVRPCRERAPAPAVDAVRERRLFHLLRARARRRDRARADAARLR